MDALLQRAELLIQQKRFSDAEQVLKQLLLQDPNAVEALSLMTEVKFQQDELDEADRLIDTAIFQRPDIGHLFFMKSRIAIHRNAYDKAESLIQHAIALEPQTAHYYAIWAMVKLNRKKYQEALDLADQALELDAASLLALNTRSTALLKLNKKQESADTIEGALREDPNNAYTHANYGCGLLEKGDAKKALEHFREALKIEPNMSFAQGGMIEALKARYAIYRLFLKYAFWLGNLTKRYQWGVIIGFYLLTQFLKQAAKTNATLELFLTPLVYLLGIIAFSTWLITPLSNLFLRLNPFGKHLLDKNEIRSSNFVAISLVAFIVSLAMVLFTDYTFFEPISLFALTMVIPFSAMFAEAKFKNLFLYYTIALFCIGCLAVAQLIKSDDEINNMAGIYFIGFIGFQFAVNYFRIQRSNY